MSKRKSLVSNFADLSNVSSQENAVTQEIAKPQKRMAAGVVGATKMTLTELREDRDRLQAELANTNQALFSLDPKLVDPSPFRDRLEDDNDEAFELFKQSIADEKQKSPITVRHHPEAKGRYQVIFGHRRLRAARELETEVIAQLVDYSDRDLIMAQGIENSARQDLSWIEKALFANQMQAAGIKAKDIKAALLVDDAQMSKFRAVVNKLSVAVIEQIGRTPGIGRPRWLELVDLISKQSEMALVAKTLSSDKVLSLPSDQRFLAVLSALKARLDKGSRTSSHEAKAVTVEGLGKAVFCDGSFQLSVAKSDAIQFNAFMNEELPILAKRFANYKERDNE